VLKVCSCFLSETSLLHRAIGLLIYTTLAGDRYFFYRSTEGLLRSDGSFAIVLRDRRRAEQLYQQLDMLQHLRQQARRELLAESRQHPITAKLRQIPSLGPIRSALAVALIQTPHRFRTKRQLWTYSGLGLETRDCGEYDYVQGQVRRRKKQVSIRGLNKDHNHDLKGLFKAAATRASVQPGPFQDFYQRSLAKGIKPTMARLTLARKIAAITLTLWKKGENFDAEKLKSQAA